MSETGAKRLRALGLWARSGEDPLIRGLSANSRDIRPGWLFAALPGHHVHGARFTAEALDKGAVAVLTDSRGKEDVAAAIRAGNHEAVLIVPEDDPRAAFARASAMFFGAQPETVVAVTGTNGKTSVASFTRQIFQVAGFRAVNLGTTGVEGDFNGSTTHTTPDPVALHQLMAQLAREGVTHTAMEASSHGLDQRRLDGVHLAAGAFTNLSQDHLDYHKTMDAYFSAKAGLVTRLLPEDAPVVVNLDDPWGARLAGLVADRGAEVIGVGRSDAASLRLLGSRFLSDGQELRLAWHGQTHLVRLRLIGDFQGENAALAAGLAIAAGVKPSVAIEALGRLEGVRGRMQLAAQRDNGAPVFVDYAHTPDAVARAARALRPHVMGRIIVVLGAGGDRDQTKRPLMGRAAMDNADQVIVTDDNPRTEDPSLIRRAVLAGAPGAIEIADRAEAILTAIDMLEPGDAALIAGKGHETGQTVGDVVYPFDDAEAASVAVAALEGRGA